MKHILAILMVGLVVAGCSTTKPIVNQTQIIVHEPPSTLYNCPQESNFPVGEGTTNKQIAGVIERLYRANRTCGTNMNAIRQNIQDAKEILSK